MPHLAPLAWALTPLMFWLILLSLSSALWWSSNPSFPICVKSQESSKMMMWNWS